jgi:hypothetical protein
MIRKILIVLGILAGTATGGFAQSTGAASAALASGVSSGYAPVDGLRLYYEIHGSGKPLVLIHGGFGSIETFGPVLTALSASRKVIAVDLQGHGRTADIDRPIRYELMAGTVWSAAEGSRLEPSIADAACCVS